MSEPASNFVSPGTPTPSGTASALGSVVVAEFRDLWEQGQSLSVQEFLERRPELRDNKDVVLDLIYEEYCRRLDAGQSPDPAEFAGRFPSFKTSLCKLLVAHQFMDQGLRTDVAETAWPALGSSFQGFTLVRELGRGSFARVYLAHEEALGNRLVAIKVSRAGLAEADILGRLAHENIVPIHSVSQHAGTGLSVVCMPNLGKTTLLNVLDHAFQGPQLPRRANVIADALQEGAVEVAGDRHTLNVLARKPYVDAVLDIGRQLADALAFVHAQNIFHRDLKPSNILLDPNGRAMLLDFNLSADQEQAQQPLGGTIPYMSPEQLRMTDPTYQGPACVLDARSDLYSLGVILFEALSGQHPFGPLALTQSAADFRAQLLQRQAGGPRSLRQLNPDVDPRVARVIERCLAYAPENRYASGDELARTLKRCLAPLGKVRRFCSRRPRLVAASGLAAAAMVAVLVVVPAFREPYPQRQFRDGVAAFAEKQYGQALHHFSESLQHNEEPQTLFWRGRTHLQMGNVDAALQDLDQAKKVLGDSGEFWALLGYCNQLRQPPKYSQAAAYYQKALDLGYANAALYNNLGYCCLKQPKGGEPQADACFHKALALDGNLQQALHNLARMSLVKASRKGGEAALEEGRKAIEQAIKLGPPTPELFYDAARLHLEAFRRDSKNQQLQDKAGEYARRALALGLNPDLIKKGPLFEPIRRIPQVQQALQNPGEISPPSGPQILDVLAYRPE